MVRVRAIAILALGAAGLFALTWRPAPRPGAVGPARPPTAPQHPPAQDPAAGLPTRAAAGDPEAVVQLASVPTAEAFATVVARFDTLDRARRFRVLDALARLAQPEATAFLETRVADADDGLAAAAATGLALRDPNDRELSDRLVKLMQETRSAEVRQAVLEAFRFRAGTAASFAYLAEIAHDTGQADAARTAAVLALASAHPDEAEGILRAALRDLEGDAVRVAVQHLIDTDFGRHPLSPEGCRQH